MATWTNPSAIQDGDSPLLYPYFCEEVAKNPGAPPKLLEGLVRWWPQHSGVQEAAALNPNTKEETLRLIWESKEGSTSYVERALASNPSTPRDILEKLARKRDADVRREVTANPSSPPELLRKLANSSYQWIRKAVALNPSCPEDVLWKLAMDPVPEVARSAVMNPKLSPETAAAVVYKRYKRDKGLLPEALLFLEGLPEDAGLWGELWGAADEKWRAYIRNHPFGRQIWLLKALGR